MAKLTRYSDGAFYDAFGGKLGQVEEIWAGDSFNRSTTCCNYVAAANNGETSFTAINPDAFAPPISTVGELTLRADDLSDSVYLIKDKLCELQEQINALKVTPSAPKGIRAALKTLQYAREVE